MITVEDETSPHEPARMGDPRAWRVAQIASGASLEPRGSGTQTRRRES